MNGDQTDAGTYEARAIELSSANYKLPEDDTVTQEYTIAPAPLYIPELQVPYSGSNVFTEHADGVQMADGTAQPVPVTFTASSADVGSYVYTSGSGEPPAVDDGKADGAEEAEAAKTYTASMGGDNKNYEIASGAMLIIEKADLTYVAPKALGGLYTGQAQELVEAGTADGGEMQYSFYEDGPYSINIPTGIEIDTYQVWYKVVGDRNHNDVGPWSVTVKIYEEEPDTPDEQPHKPGGNWNGGVAEPTEDCPRDEHCTIWPFTDARTTAWYHDGVHYCIENSLMNGYGGNIWGPNNTLSRAMLAQILYNQVGKPAVTGDSPFSDVAAGMWYSDAITWASKNGVVLGYGNGKFGPDDPVTREQMAVMLYQNEQRSGGSTGFLPFTLNFTDASDISG